MSVSVVFIHFGLQVLISVVSYLSKLWFPVVWCLLERLLNNSLSDADQMQKKTQHVFVSSLQTSCWKTGSDCAEEKLFGPISTRTLKAWTCFPPNRPLSRHRAVSNYELEKLSVNKSQGVGLIVMCKEKCCFFEELYLKTEFCVNVTAQVICADV